MFIFNYLSQFWNAVAEITLSGTTYTIDWFQAIGNAVAGAIGYILLTPFQVIVEFGLAFAWIISNLFNIIIAVLSPLKFIGVYLSSFLSTLLNAPTSTSFTFDSGAISLVQGVIPYWSTFSAIIVGVIIIGAILTTIKATNL